MSATDTIFALSSGAVPSGVAVVRLSGPGVRFGLETLVGSVPQPRRASLRFIRDATHGVIDRGLVIFFPAPASFTGEDVAEFHLHGGRAVVAALIATLAALPGFRPAEQGEFSRRAFLNGIMDLTQAEGLLDLISAETEAQRRQALRQAGGELQRLYDGWRERLIRTRALVEAELDFAEEEDVPAGVGDTVRAEIASLLGEIDAHLAAGDGGERLRDGAEIVVLGPPNAGKSSLINALAKRDVAIVTAEPGTTRDLIEVRLDLAGYPVTVVDTAGLREATGAVEAEGIRRAAVRGRAADLVLWLCDLSAAPIPPPDLGAVPVLRLGTKADLIDSDSERPAVGVALDLVISTRSGLGMTELTDRMGRFASEMFSFGEAPVVSRARYRVALLDCRAALAHATGEGRAELRAELLRRATDAIGRMTGRIGVEDLLDVIFREFCIGK